MLVWATEFPAPPRTDPDDVLAIACSWLKGSPHLPWRSVALPDTPDGESTRTVHDGQVVEIARVREVEGEWAALRHSWTEDSKREWVTEIVAYRSEDGATIGVRVECNLMVAGASLPRPKKPYVVKLLMSKLAGGGDSWLVVDDCPTFLEESQVDEAAAIVQGTTAVNLPILCVSTVSGRRLYVDPNEIAEWLAGMAHVVVEPSRQFSFALARNTNWTNPYGGAIAVFWPRAVEPQTRLVPRDFESGDEMAAAAAERVRIALTAVRPTPELTWSFVQGLVARQRIDALRREGSTEIEAYVQAFDAELAAKDARIKQAEAEVARLHAEVRRAESLARTGMGLLTPGREVELYPGELLDAVLHTLRLGRSSLESKGRRRHIVDDLLEANAASDMEESFLEQIKKAFASTGQLTTGNRRVLEDLGFEITDDGRHHRAVYQGDNRYAFTISKTSSDHRAGKNLASVIARVLFR